MVAVSGAGLSAPVSISRGGLISVPGFQGYRVALVRRGSGSVVLVSSDSGVTWSEVASPASGPSLLRPIEGGVLLFHLLGDRAYCTVYDLDLSQSPPLVRRDTFLASRTIDASSPVFDADAESRTRVRIACLQRGSALIEEVILRSPDNPRFTGRRSSVRGATDAQVLLSRGVAHESQTTRDRTVITSSGGGTRRSVLPPGSPLSVADGSLVKTVLVTPTNIQLWQTNVPNTASGSNLLEGYVGTYKDIDVALVDGQVEMVGRDENDNLWRHTEGSWGSPTSLATSARGGFCLLRGPSPQLEVLYSDSNSTFQILGVTDQSVAPTVTPLTSGFTVERTRETTLEWSVTSSTPQRSFTVSYNVVGGPTLRAITKISSGTKYTIPPVELSNGNYEWTVSVTDEEGRTANSTVATFQVVDPVPVGANRTISRPRPDPGLSAYYFRNAANNGDTPLARFARPGPNPRLSSAGVVINGSYDINRVFNTIKSGSNRITVRNEIEQVWVSPLSPAIRTLEAGFTEIFEEEF